MTVTATAERQQATTADEQPVPWPSGPREMQCERPALAWRRLVCGTWYYYSYSARRGLPGTGWAYRWEPQLQEWLLIREIELDGTEDPARALRFARELALLDKVADADGTVYEVTAINDDGVSLTALRGNARAADAHKPHPFTTLWSERGPLTRVASILGPVPATLESPAREQLPHRVPGTQRRPVKMQELIRLLDLAGWDYRQVAAGQYEVTRPGHETHTVVMHESDGEAALLTARARLRQFGLDQDLAALAAAQQERDGQHAPAAAADTQRPPMAPGEFRAWITGLDPYARDVVEALTSLVLLAEYADGDDERPRSLRQLREQVRASFEAAQRALDGYEPVAH